MLFLSPRDWNEMTDPEQTAAEPQDDAQTGAEATEGSAEAE